MSDCLSRLIDFKLHLRVYDNRPAWHWNTRESHGGRFRTHRSGASEGELGGPYVWSRGFSSADLDQIRRCFHSDRCP